MRQTEPHADSPIVLTVQALDCFCSPLMVIAVVKEQCGLVGQSKPQFVAGQKPQEPLLINQLEREVRFVSCRSAKNKAELAADTFQSDSFSQWSIVGVPVAALKYWELVDDIKQFRRDGRTVRAAALLLKCVEAIEAEGGCPAPWYFEQLAIIFRKEGQPHHEVRILERYMLACEKAGEAPIADLIARLEKARTYP